MVTDSSAYLPNWLITRHGVYVVPLSVVVDGREYREGIDISPQQFYDLLPFAKSVSTSQPPPGSFVDCYEDAACKGAQTVLSIHIGSSLSGTIGSAELAARSSPVPVTVVDTGQASFAEGLCVWEAIDALAGGATNQEAAACARAAGASVGNTFVVKALELLKRGGRLKTLERAPAGVPVLVLTAAGVKVVGTAASLEEAVDTMVREVEEAARQAAGKALRVGVGHGAAPAIASALQRRVEAMAGVSEVVEYTVGPVIGAHTGAGTAGAVFLARPVTVEAHAEL